MKVCFVINDSSRLIFEIEFFGRIYSGIHRRSVEIELTPEQVDKIGICTIGVDCGRDVMETIESVSVSLSQNKEEEEK